MQFVVVAVGRLKERYWVDAVEEYRKRITPYASCVLEEVADEPDHLPLETVKQIEGRRIITKLRERDYVIALDVQGKRMSSEVFADHLSIIRDQGYGRYVFVIGGSLGLDEHLLQRANLRLSFSEFTFPHQLMRVILLEQMYRALRIQVGAPYHK